MPSKTKPDKLDSFYSHISRMYNSAINMLAAVIFGWLSFVGFAIGKIDWYWRLSIALVIYLLAIYVVYFRILRHGRFIRQIEDDLDLRNYIVNTLLPLDKTLPIKWLANLFFKKWGFGQRKDSRSMSPEEKVLCILVILFFIISSLILFLSPKS